VVSDDEPAGPSATPRYDFDLISDLEALIVEGEQGWRDLFDELGLVPYEVVYEDVVADGGLERAVPGVLDHLGLDGRGVDIPHPRTHRQSDDLNEAWVARYTDERAEALGTA